jgi:hypothetical protein
MELPLLIRTSTFLAIICVASQLLLCLFWINLWLGIGVYNTFASKICVKLLKPPKIPDSNAQHFLSDLLTHSWFHSMVFALPGYQFPCTVMNRSSTFLFYLVKVENTETVKIKLIILDLNEWLEICAIYIFQRRSRGKKIEVCKLFQYFNSCK